MRTFINFITAFSFLSIATAATLPLAAVYSGKDNILSVLNYLAIAQAFSVFLDSNTIIRAQLAFAKDDKRLLKVAYDFANRSLIVVPLALCIGAVELWLLGFSAFIAIGARHVQNFFRMCVPQVKEFKKFSFISNMIACIRNLSLLAVIIAVEAENFSLLLAVILLIEWVCLPVYFMKNQPIIIWQYRPDRIVKNAARNAIKSCLHSWSAKTPIMNSMRSIGDRLIVGFLFPDATAIQYLKFKAAFQFVDAFVGVFSYQIHLEMIATKTVGILKRYLTIGFLATGVGVAGLFLMLGIQPSEMQLLLWFILSLFASFKRVSDSVVGSFLLSTSKFKQLVLIYSLEFFLVIFSLLLAVNFLNVDGVGAFYIFTVVTALSSFLLVSVAIRAP